MRKRDCCVLIGAVAVTRFLFRSHFLYDLDSVDFALAIKRFDPAVYQPHPPGYFLYVWLGRLLNTWFHDPNAALVTISILASCAAAPILYVLAEEWFGTRAARFAGGLFLLSPLAWFHGTVALTYVVEAFFSALIGYLCWRIYTGSTQWIFPCAVGLGLAAGVRPSSLLFLGPLFLFSLGKVPGRKALAGLGALLLTLVAWFVPMLVASGGPRAYFSALVFLWRMAPGGQNARVPFAFLTVARLITIGGIFGLCFGSAFPLFLRPLCSRRTTRPPQVAFTWVWIAPALLFFTFVFLAFVNSGYLLVTFPPVCAWVARWASDWFHNLRFPMPLKGVLLAAAAAVNIAIFLDAPVYCSYGAVRRFEAELTSLERALPRAADPEHTLLIGFDSHFLGFRHAGYYFPDYALAEYPEARFSTGTEVFFMQQRDTRLAGSIDTRQFVNFLLFPLPPGGGEFQAYTNKMRTLLSSDVHLETVDGWEFMSAPIEDLPVLFPMTAKPDSAVSTARNLPGAPVYKR